MTERVGTLLRELRKAQGWSLGQLAQRAKVSKAALSQWETGKHQPRAPELEAVLTALGATSGQRRLALARIEAPRSLRLLNAPADPDALGAPPTAGDLLRALRQRGGWTQEQVALRVGVGQNSVARWERGERLPSTEQMQALCFVLDAQEDELTALTTGRFAEPLTPMPTDVERVEERLHGLLHLSQQREDLHFMALERALWNEAAQKEPMRALLAHAYAFHAHHLSLYGEWDRAAALAERSLALTERQEHEPHFTVRAALVVASATVSRAKSAAPDESFHLLKSWLPRSMNPDFTCWILSDMAGYLAQAGEIESAVSLAAQAVAVAQGERGMRRIDHARLLLTAGRVGAALESLPSLGDQDGDCFVYEAFVRVEAYQRLGNSSAAHDWLQRAYAVIEARGLARQRPQADALAQSF